MPTKPETKFTIIVALGMAFGALCVILGVRGSNYALLGAGILALVSGAVLLSMMLHRWSSKTKR
ncbi:hypothetical protein [Streptomyces sp. NPDC017940]|uniref:hypothetical protein n=1 Tax=Streptomyces sp. NPDC017940 TaxID=3365017 RepID=UPI0037B6AEFF